MLRTSFWRRIQAFLRRHFRPRAKGTSDPFAGVPQRKRRGPSGGLSAAAVMEPDDERMGVEAVGRRLLRHAFVREFALYSQPMVLSTA